MCVIGNHAHYIGTDLLCLFSTYYIWYAAVLKI